MAKWTPVGSYSRVVQLQQDLGEGQSVSGDHLEDWSTYATVYASLEPLSGREFLLAQQSVASATVAGVARIRYRAGVLSGHRMLYGGRVLNVEAVVNVEERDRELHLYYSESQKALTLEIVDLDSARVADVDGEMVASA